jgi:membrane protease YdiL (CAAX protease family)
MTKSWSEIREVGWGVLAVLLVAIIAAAAFVNLYFFRLAAPQVVVDATAGLVDWTLMGSAIILVIVVGGVIFGLGHQRPADVGLIARKLPAAIGVTAALWVLTQVLLSVGAWATLGEIPVNPRWAERGVTAMLGALLAQLFGNALAEEIIYRGFLPPQTWLKLRGGLLAHLRWRLLLAALISQAIFALAHIPNRLFNEMAGAEIALDMVVLVIFGLYYLFLYLRTSNLFFAIGVHALANQPLTLVQSDLAAPLIMLLALGAAFFWRSGAPHTARSAPDAL